MSKSIKKILTATSALLMLASAGAMSVNTSVNAKRHYRTHRIYRYHHSRWHYGVPRVLKGYWRGSLVRSNQYSHHGYVRDLVSVGKNSQGFNPFPYWYNARKHFKMSGATNGEFWHPHYKYYGHGKYVITSGDAFNGKPYSMKYVIRMHGRNHFSLKHDGHFTRVHSWHQWLRK